MILKSYQIVLTVKNYYIILLYFSYCFFIPRCLSTSLAPIHWGSSNPMFKASKNDHVIEVKLYDDIDFVCPYYEPDHSFNDRSSDDKTSYDIREKHIKNVENNHNDGKNNDRYNTFIDNTLNNFHGNEKVNNKEVNSARVSHEDEIYLYDYGEDKKTEYDYYGDEYYDDDYDDVDISQNSKSKKVEIFSSKNSNYHSQNHKSLRRKRDKNKKTPALKKRRNIVKYTNSNRNDNVLFSVDKLLKKKHISTWKDDLDRKKRRQKRHKTFIPTYMPEYYIVYMVSKQEYDTCSISDHTNATLILNCSQPSVKKRFTILFEPYQSIPNTPEYQRGFTYYFITTSTGTKTGINNKRHGSCHHKNLKLSIRVCCSGKEKTHLYDYNMEDSFSHNKHQQRVEAPLAPKKYPYYKKYQTQKFNTQRASKIGSEGASNQSTQTNDQANRHSNRQRSRENHVRKKIPLSGARRLSSSPSSSSSSFSFTSSFLLFSLLKSIFY